MNHKKITVVIRPSTKINLQATVKKLKQQGSPIQTQDQLAEAIFKRKDLIELVK